MILWNLFLVFFKIGIVSFGGGYGMISLIREEIMLRGWMDEESFLNMIAISESTPGPLAVNMATYVGSLQGGFAGALVSTLGVVLPSFMIILLISALLKKLIKYPAVKAILGGIRPIVIGLILSTAITLWFSLIFTFSKIGDSFSFDASSFFIFVILFGLASIWKIRFKKSLSPIFLIVFSACLGILINVF